MRLIGLLALILLIALASSCEKECHCPVVEVEKAALPEPVRSERPVPTAWRDDVLAFVELGYGDMHDREHRSLDFRTEALNTDAAKQAVALVPSYNAFDGAKVAAGLEALRGDIMFYVFGRDGSPVLFVHLPVWTNQRERECPDQHCVEGGWGDGKGARRLTAAEHNALVQRVRAVFAELHADEIDAQSDDDHIIRVWWD